MLKGWTLRKGSVNCKHYKYHYYYYYDYYYYYYYYCYHGYVAIST